MTRFVLDPRIAAGSHPVAQLELCEARLQDDARFPWIVLVPMREALVEIDDLDTQSRARLWTEVWQVGRAVRAMGDNLGRTVLKLNIGQLGNVVTQLHVHVVGRRSDDAAWPAPAWGFGGAESYGPETLEVALAAARSALGP